MKQKKMRGRPIVQEIISVFHGDTFVAHGMYRRSLKHGEWKGSYEDRSYTLRFKNGVARSATVAFGAATYSGPIHLAANNTLFFKRQWCEGEGGNATLEWDNHNEAKYHTETEKGTVIDAIMVADGSYTDMKRWFRESNTTHFSRQPMTYHGGKWHAPGNPRGWIQEANGQKIHGDWLLLEDTEEWILKGEDGREYAGAL